MISFYKHACTLHMILQWVKNNSTVLDCRYWNGLMCDPSEARGSFPGPNHRFLLSFSGGSLHDGEWNLINVLQKVAGTSQKSVQLMSILLQGRIACANVLSDLYAMGITECDNMLMLLSVSQKMNEKVRWNLSAFILAVIYKNFAWCFCKIRKLSYEMVNLICSVPMFSQEREQVMPLMMKGFRDAAEEGGTSVTGGQTVINPWIIVGGVASVVCQPNDFIMWVFLTNQRTGYLYTWFWII